MARQQGLDVRASLDPGRETYALVDPETDAILAGFTLERIETHLLAAIRGESGT